MARRRAAPTPAQALATNRAAALDLAQGSGLKATRAMLAAAQSDLEHRLKKVRPGSEDTFTAVQMRATLEQVRAVVLELNVGIKGQLAVSTDAAAVLAAENTMGYLMAAEKKFRGVGAQPLALRPAAMLDAARKGARGSLLRRIAGDARHKGHAGVLARYGGAVVDRFERRLRVGLVARKPWAEVREDLRRESPFLRDAPAHWAERIVRTECMGGYNAASLASIQHAHKDLGDMLKVLSCVFDERTGSDSLDVHGQVRRVDEAFETWFGASEHPPDRPNDRAVVVPHRLSWPLPASLQPLPRDLVLARWAAEGHKGAPPERPVVSTVRLLGAGGGED